MYSVTQTIATDRYVDFTIPGHWEYDEYVPSTTHREQAYNWTSLIIHGIYGQSMVQKTQYK